MNNIRYIRKIKKMTQAQVSHLTGISRVQIMRLENGTRRLNQDNILKIANAFNCKPEDLISDSYLAKKNNQMQEDEHYKNLVNLPFYIYTDLLDYKKFKNQNILDVNNKRFVIDRSITKDITKSVYDNLIVIKYSGKSMSPKIEDDSYIFVDISQNTINQDAIYVFYYQQQLYINNIQKIPNKYKIISNNQLYDPWYISSNNKDKIQIIGMVKGCINRI